jgi:hypothetical protein
MAKASKRNPTRKKTGAAVATPSRLKLVLLLVGVVLLFGAAFYGLLSVESGGQKRPDPASSGAPPVDHIDESSRDALREILREESDE